MLIVGRCFGKWDEQSSEKCGANIAVYKGREWGTNQSKLRVRSTCREYFYDLNFRDVREVELRFYGVKSTQ